MGNILETAGRSLDTLRPARRELTSLNRLEWLAVLGQGTEKAHAQRAVADVRALLEAIRAVRIAFHDNAVPYIHGYGDLLAAAARLDGVEA